MLGIELVHIKIPFNMHKKDVFYNMTLLVPLISNMKKIRQLGSVALELCYVASGRIDAYVDLRNKIRATDLAAAYLIIKEAGAVILTPDGTDLIMELEATAKTSFIVAANQILSREILKHLKIKNDA